MSLRIAILLFPLCVAAGEPVNEELPELANPSVPDLVKLLGDENYQVRHRAAYMLRLIDKSKAHEALAMFSADIASENNDVRQSAFRRLNTYASDAAPLAAKAVQYALRGRATIYDVDWIARSCNAISMPIISEHLKSQDAHVRLRAVELASRMQIFAHDLEDDVLNLLNDPSREVRALAIRSLPDMDATPAKAVPALIEQLDGENARDAISALGEFKSSARIAAPKLRQVTGKVRPIAVVALAGIDPDMPGIAEALAGLESIWQLEHDHLDPIYDAVDSLGLRAAPMVPKMCEHLTGRPDIASRILRKVLWRGKAALPEIQESFLKADWFVDPAGNDPDYDDHSGHGLELLYAVSRMGKPAAEFLPVLFENVRNNRHSSRAYLLRAIEWLGNDAYSTEAVAFLVEQFGRLNTKQYPGHSERRPELICRALGNFGKKAVSALPELERMLMDEKNAWHAARAIESIVADLPEAQIVEKYRALLDGFYSKEIHSHDARNRISASVFLLKRGVEKWNTPGLENLLKGLDDPSLHIRNDALKAISELGPLAASTVPRLAQLLDCPCDGFRVEVLETLEKIGPAAHLAIPALVQMLDWKNTGDPRLQHEFDLSRELSMKKGHYIRQGWPDSRLAPVRAVRTLIHIDRRTAQAAIPFLRTSLTFFQPDARDGTSSGRHRFLLHQIEAAECLLMLDAENNLAVKRLTEILDVPWRESAARVLARFVPESSERTLPILTDSLNRRCDPETIKALKNLGPRARPALPILKEIAAEASYPFRQTAAEAIAAIER